MSSGELKVEGDRAHYELRMPMYEVAHVHEPEHTLLEQVRFKGAGAWAKPLNPSCSEQQGTYFCAAEYQFPAPVDVMEVECTLARVTVPNHVHLLHAYRGDKSDQAVFDLSFTSAEIRFRPPTAFETAARELSSGFMRAAGGLAPLLFLSTLVMAARTRRELIALTAAFLFAEVFACALVPRVHLSASPRFIEAAAALTVAYLAFEIVLLPESEHRWLVVGVLGLFHGAYFSMFLAQSGFRAPAFLAGVAFAELLLIAIFAAVLGVLTRFKWMRHAVPIAASLLLVTGIVWFLLRLRA
ncbi:MAG TPA: HupE/UreJ family protein [Bryobacteraceae bacterium]|nr:HupE/UreJ family protein [Bryobacteraceae bacterium]